MDLEGFRRIPRVVRLLLQRVTGAKLSIEGALHCEIGPGLVVLMCAERGDTLQDHPVAAQKLLNLRIFAGDKPMDRSLLDKKGDLMVVSQFTLAARLAKGRRPSFDRAMPPELAKVQFESFVKLLSAEAIRVQSGVFGANMQVALTNDGPVTIGFCVRDQKVVDAY